MASITCAKCKGTHDSVRLVRACHEGRLVLTMTLTDNLNETPVFCVDCRIRNTSHQNAEGTVGRYRASDLHPEACTKLQHELELAPMMPMKTEACAWEGTWEEWVTLYRAHVASQQVPGLPGVTYRQAELAFSDHDADKAEYARREQEQEREAYRAEMAWEDRRRDANLAAAKGTANPRYAAVRALRGEAKKVLAALASGHDKFRVAVQLDPADKLRFFQIDTPLKGNWKGCLFLKEQASDELYKVREIKREEAVLRAVIADAEGALTRYGLELGVCGMCGRTLTDEESRARGIGPVCADKL